MIWKQVKIKDLCDVKGGKRLPLGEDFSSEGYPYIRARDIKNGKVKIESPVFVSEKVRSKIKNYITHTNDILITIVGVNIGDVAIVPHELNEASLTENAVKLTNYREIDPGYLIHYLSNSYVKEIMQQFSAGAAQGKLGIYKIHQIPVILPPRNTQQKIAAILSAYDDLIENNKRRIALLEKMAEEIYREWFVRMRFPEHEKVKMVKGVPEGWEMVRLEKAFEFCGGGTPSKEISRYWNNGDVNWYTPSDITASDGIFLERSGDQCTEEGLARSSAKLFPAYSVMMTSRATIGAIGVNTTPASTNQGFITCIPNEQYPLPYLYQWLKLTKPYFELLSGGSTFLELTKTTFKKIEILTPPKSIVNQFNSIQTPIFKMVEMYQKEMLNLVTTRNLLLPRLISGKLSVENLDIQFPPSMREEIVPQAGAQMGFSQGHPQASMRKAEQDAKAGKTVKGSRNAKTRVADLEDG